jgi:hypothetical protein
MGGSGRRSSLELATRVELLPDQSEEPIDIVPAWFRSLDRHLLDQIEQRRIERGRDSEFLSKQNYLAIQEPGLRISAPFLKIGPGRRVGSSIIG